MAIPVWQVGQVLSASDVNTWFIPVAVKKTSNTARASNTSITSDPQLTLPVAANADYKFEALILFNGAASASDFQWRFTVPSGAVMNYTCPHADATGTLVGISIVYNAPSVLTSQTTGTGNDRSATMTGMLTTAATAGNLVFQWAQNTSNGTATTVETGSYLYLQRCG